MRIVILTAVLAASPYLTVQPGLADAIADPMVELGKALFFDPALSVNGTQSCATCHVPSAGFAAQGGDNGMQTGAVGTLGSRKPPTAAYAFSPVFHHTMEDGAPLFIGGLFHDGRATGEVTGLPLVDQAEGPILNPAEMALPNKACAVQRACANAGLSALDPQSCEAVKALNPCTVASGVEKPESEKPGSELPESEKPESEKPEPNKPAFDATPAFTLITQALAAYEASPQVSPFSSRFDA